MAKTILIVGDSKAVRRSISFVLEQNGYQAVEAAGGLEALALLGTTAVDCIISDVDMPDMNGIELVEAVRSGQERSELPILVLTTESQSSGQDRSRDAGVTGWIVKPFSTDRLLSAVRRVVSLKK